MLLNSRPVGLFIFYDAKLITVTVPVYKTGDKIENE
jgi:hypothetical protein